MVDRTSTGPITQKYEGRGGRKWMQGAAQLATPTVLDARQTGYETRQKW